MLVIQFHVTLTIPGLRREAMIAPIAQMWNHSWLICPNTRFYMVGKPKPRLSEPQTQCLFTATGCERSVCWETAPTCMQTRWAKKWDLIKLTF